MLLSRKPQASWTADFAKETGMQLAGKVVVVTGAFGQLGRAVTREVLAQGAQVVMLDRNTGDAPQGAAAWQADLTSLPQVTDALAQAAQQFGRIDALVNVAGGFRWQTLDGSADLAEWSLLFAMNLQTCVTASKAALPHLERQGAGRIVNIGALAALKGASGMGAYAASKSGVLRFTESLADELKL
jgi:NAD(P)-dependent dehydrogenase (short-subunit alcohol dehydrogenase family)